MSSFSYKRSERLSDLLRKTIATFLLTEAKDPRAQAVTITKVETQDDLQLARIFYRSFDLQVDDQRAIEDLTAHLNRMTGFLRVQLKHELHLRKIPELRFVYDASLDAQNRVAALLRSVAAERSGE